MEHSRLPYSNGLRALGLRNGNLSFTLVIRRFICHCLVACGCQADLKLPSPNFIAMSILKWKVILIMHSYSTDSCLVHP